MGAKVSARVTQLHSLSRRQLLELWQKHYEKPAPLGIRRELMIPCLAYRIQEICYGGLKPSSRAELRRLAASLKKDPSSELSGRALIKPGARLFRRWRGQMHEVFVIETGYEYRGDAYRSLSEVARKITGTRWSGPAFFGLKKVHSLPGNPDG